MKPNGVSAELLLRVRGERLAIDGELPSLELQDARLQAAAAEDTLSGHLRQAIHASHRPLRDIARESGIDFDALFSFLEGEQGVQSDALDRLARAAGVVITLVQDK